MGDQLKCDLVHIVTAIFQDKAKAPTKTMQSPLSWSPYGFWLIFVKSFLRLYHIYMYMYIVQRYSFIKIHT